MGHSGFVELCIPDTLERCFPRAGRMRPRLRLKLKAWLNLRFSLLRAGREDGMNNFPFIHQPKAIHFHFFIFMVERKKLEEAFQLNANHLQKRIALAPFLRVLYGITKEVIRLLVHCFYFIPFGALYSRVWPHLAYLHFGDILGLRKPPGP